MFRKKLKKKLLIHEGGINLFDQTYKLLKFFASVKKVYGRKKLQKIIHLMQYNGVEFNMKYSYYHFGPYSSGLQAEVQDMVDKGYIEEAKFGEGYCYSITDKGQEFMKTLESLLKEKKFNLPVKNIIELNQHPSQFLEVLSTYVFLLESGYDEKSALSKTKTLKPHLEHFIDEVVEYYKENLH